MGVEVPEANSLRDRRPLCRRALGAGKPRRKCSSSASVPLSLAGVDSFVKEGKGEDGSVLSSDLAPEEAAASCRESLRSTSRWAAWGMSWLRWW